MQLHCAHDCSHMGRYVGKLGRIAEIGHRSRAAPPLLSPVSLHSPIASTMILRRISRFVAAGVSKTGILKLIAIFILFLNLFCRSDDVKAFFEQLRAELTAT